MPSPIRIPVRLGSRGYEIWIGSNHLHRLGPEIRRLGLGNRAVLLSNPTIQQHARAVIRALSKAGFPIDCLAVADTERSKSMRSLGHLIASLARLDRPGRRFFLVLVGGGVVGDVGGLLAGLYRRGLPYVQVPTTLLAQVDSSIGGKTGIDLPEGKNLIGLFNQPRLVFTDLAFLESLSDRQFRSGLAEIAKCGVIRDPEIFTALERIPSQRIRSYHSHLSWLIARALRVKVSVVEKDELETLGVRTLLNFGHTFGHALEAATHYSGVYTHGEAVAVGMRVATEISLRLKRIAPAQADRIIRLLGHLGLPTTFRGVSLEHLLRAMSHDKKWSEGVHRWVLPTRIGRVVVHRSVPEKVVRAAIRESLED